MSSNKEDGGQKKLGNGSLSCSFHYENDACEEAPKTAVPGMDTWRSL